MRTAFRLACIAALSSGCGGSGGREDAGHHPSPAADAPGDGTPTHDAAPDVGVDAFAGPCYTCNTSGLCFPNQSASAGCAYGDGRLGDLCDVNAPACNCLSYGGDIGFCTMPCAINGDCLPYGALCVDFGAPTGAWCAWICTDDSQCPPGEFPFPDAGVGPEPPPDTGPPEPLPDGAEPPPDAPPQPDASAPVCYDSCDNVAGVSGLACHADQSAGAGCAFGTGAPGDTCLMSNPGFCTSGVCLTEGTDTVGFCSEPCVTAGNCSHPAECVDFGVTDYCIYTCTVPSDCPP
jgi:hypothetical protein